MKIDPYRNGVSIVLLGAFNPAIFSPSWFRNTDIISESEFSASNIEIQHRELSVFRLEWMDALIQLDRFKVATEQSPYIRLSDFVLKTFRDYLSHTPIYAMGINRMVEFDVGKETTRNEIGQKLAPPSSWGKWGEQIASGAKNNHGGMRQLIMEQRDIDDREHGYIRAEIKPSEQKSSGIRMDINDHFQIKTEDLTGNQEVMDFLSENYETSLRRSEGIINGIMELKDECGK